MEIIQAQMGDITRLNVAAIVNAANTSLLGGGGVDGAIHKAAGRELLEECKSLGGCKTGDAKITNGYKLSAKYVIHAVGPVWKDGKSQEKELLASCYSKSLQLAVDNKIKSIAFPCISTGVYRFPKNLAASIAVQTVREFLKEDQSLNRIIFCCFSEGDCEMYNQLIHSTPV
ncbi:MAG: O-acetyl-ADP-ribose deacetylase [Candidatus Omnitrophica bacterium]|nr:O-acetyl-ADP-ribose deacetylase [Candidatus Omnitrophota bacterium]